MSICLPRVFDYRDHGLYVTYGHDSFKERLSALKTITVAEYYFLSFHRCRVLENKPKRTPNLAKICKTLFIFVTLFSCKSPAPAVYSQSLA